MPAPLLVMGVGNPSRGDDALGPLFVERVSRALERDVRDGKLEFLTDFQLQIEHALDCAGRQRVLFVDASVAAAPPFEFARVVARRDASHTSHALSPAAVLDAQRALAGEPPEAWVLAIRGERFELGEGLSASAQSHLDAAVDFFLGDRGARLRLAGEGTPSVDAPDAGVGGRRVEVVGVVQGVGLRPWVFRTARSLGLSGVVWNTRGNVTIEAFGSSAALDALVRALEHAPPPAARIRSVGVVAIAPRVAEGFRIGASATGELSANLELVLPADLAPCAACIAELEDPQSRFFRYPFTSCTECGPRLSIARALPFDRATTSMAEFEPCPACLREYTDPADRRFHSQTVACPSCGPRLWLESARQPAPDSSAAPVAAAGDAIDEAAARLREGAILGVQGIGAFHLVCDATQAEVVAELRRRKQRDEQPFAVLVADAAMAAELAELDAGALAALCSPVRPIVLAPARPRGSALAGVNGPSRRVGVLLPPTPLYHRLAAQLRRPLVVTSANVSGGPPIIDAMEARQSLGGLVDAFLFHDRPIARRVEDSVVAACSPTAPRSIRRARGLAALPIRLRASAPEPVLAVGGQMKNTACFVVGDEAYLTPHLGDLGLVESEAAWRRELESFEQLLGVRPEVIAHDLHPRYATTRYALGRAARRRIGVQHHVAHVLATLAELGIDEPVVGVVYDGSGWGTDGSSWGAELLLVEGTRWSRASTFRALPLAGGERAIREVWRVAFGALYDSFGAESLQLAARLPVFDGVPRAALATVLRMLETQVEVVAARGMGRWFDAVGALTLGLARASFDGHVAVALEEAAEGTQLVAPYPVELPTEVAPGAALDARHELDLRPALRALVADLLAGRSAGSISVRFHQTIVDATATLVERVLAATGVRRVVLTGGSFQNRRLARGLEQRLGPERVRMAREVPINDGGLALGQAWAAVLALRKDPV